MSQRTIVLLRLILTRSSGNKGAFCRDPERNPKGSSALVKALQQSRYSSKIGTTTKLESLPVQKNKNVCILSTIHISVRLIQQQKRNRKQLHSTTKLNVNLILLTR